MLWTEKQLENLSFKVIFFDFADSCKRRGVFVDKLLGGGVTTNQTDVVPPPLFFLKSPENKHHWPHTSFVYKNGFFFF